MANNIKLSWLDPTAYQTQPAVKQQVEADVKSAAITANAISRGATSAIIRSTIHKSKPGSDQTDHVTVEYDRANGSHVTTRHVPVS